jgi:chromate reductase, NAD(P)H dehydrogenase (quinone)
MRLLALSGSLRRASSNTALLGAASRLAPDGVEVTLFQGIGDLPLFNPDVEGTAGEPRSVLDFRAQLKAADGVLISCPEYAHGVPGAFKNALDWVVGSGELVDKPVALLNASAYSSHAHASLTETLTVMTAQLVAEASLTIPLGSSKTDEAAILANPTTAGLLRSAVAAFVRAIESRRPAGPP